MAASESEAADQVAGLQKEQDKLRHALALRDHEIAALREIAEAAGQLGSQDMQAAKVIELSKKNRALNLMLEKERQRVAQLQQTLSEATASKEGGAAQKLQAAARSAVAEAAEAADSAVKEAALWRERAQQQTNKLSQLEQKVFALESENKKLTRVLVREVGEDVPLAKVLEEGSDWKGRRETIIALRDTIRKLKEEKGVAVPTKHDETHRNVIGRLAKERAAEAEKMAAELSEARAAAEAARRQYAGATSRRKVVEEELAGLREKMAVVLRKTKNDDKLITALRAELAAAVQAGGGGGRAYGGSITGIDSAAAAQELVWTEVAQLRQQVIEQEEALEQSAKVIRYLQGQVQLQQQSTAGYGSSVGGGSLLASPGGAWASRSGGVSPQAAAGAGGAGPSGSGSGGGGGARERVLVEQLEATQDECDELRAQVRALQDDVESMKAQRPGTSGLSNELRRQVLALEEDNDRLRGSLMAIQQQQQPPRHTSSRDHSSAAGGIGVVGTGPDLLVVEPGQAGEGEEGVEEGVEEEEDPEGGWQEEQQFVQVTAAVGGAAGGDGGRGTSGAGGRSGPSSAR